MKALILILGFLFSSTFSLPAQFITNSTVQLILKGKVTDEYSGNPVGATIEFRTNTGKKFKIKSDSLSGEYQQVFQSGEKVEVYIYGWDIVRQKFIVELPDTNKYAEIEQNFAIKQLKEGLIAYKFDCFDTESSELIESCKEKLLSLDEVLRFNRNVKFEIQVTAFDTYIKTEKVRKVEKVVTERKKKKKIIEQEKYIEEPPIEKIKQLAENRYQKISKVVEEIPRAKGRLSVVPVFSSGEATPNNIPMPYDVFVVVKELKNILEK
ncbi:MAG: hypothetical protein ACK42Z_00390 [Candidatus Kapaibacteriota bacterium]